MDEMIRKELQGFREAVEEAIADNHLRGLPAYQIEDGYIIAIYPEWKKVRLEKAEPYYPEKLPWNRQP